MIYQRPWVLIGMNMVDFLDWFLLMTLRESLMALWESLWEKILDFSLNFWPCPSTQGLLAIWTLNDSSTIDLPDSKLTLYKKGSFTVVYTARTKAHVDHVIMQAYGTSFNVQYPCWLQLFFFWIVLLQLPWAFSLHLLAIHASISPFLLMNCYIKC